MTVECSEPEAQTICETEVHVWRVPLDVNERASESLLDVLDGDERQRAARFHFVQDQKRYIAAHGILRKILSCYLNFDAAQVRFGRNTYGKPYLLGDKGRSLYFNLSHSQGTALIAVARREVGVDIEHIRPDANIELLTEAICSASEQEFLQTLNDHQKVGVFFELWTRKEAFLKACGRGFSSDVKQVDVLSSFDNSKNRLVLATEDGTSWSVEQLPASDTYACALAAAGHDWKWRLMSWCST